MEKAVHDAYARGSLPVWMPGVSGGRPLLPNPNAGALYPLRMALAPLPFPLAMRIFPVLHWGLAGLGAMALLLTIGVSRAGAWVGAASYAFSGVAVSEVFFPHILPGLALLPWIVWAVARPWSRARGKAVAVALLFAVEMLAGDVFSVSLAIGAGAIWILREEAPARRPAELAAFGLAIALGALAAAPQIAATALWIPETSRAVTGMKLSESFLFSVSPWRLFELVIPYPFGSTYALGVSEVWARLIFHGKGLGLFATLYGGAFAVVAVLLLRGQRPRGARFARALGLACLAIAVLPSLLPVAWANKTSPIALRNPEKFATGLAFALAVLAGLGFDRFRAAGGPPPRLRWMIPVAALLALGAAAARFAPEETGRFVVRVTNQLPIFERLAAEKLAIGLAEAGLLWVATWLALELSRDLPRAGLPVGLVLLTLVLIAANRRIAVTFPEERLFSPTPFARFVRRRDPAGAFRVIGARTWVPPSKLEEENAGNDPAQLEFSRRGWNDSTQVLWGQGAVFNRDFDSGDLSRLESLRRVAFVASAQRGAGAFFGALGLRWSIRFRDQDPLPGYHRVGGDALMDWDEHEKALPEIRLLESWREEPGAVDAFRDLPRLAPGEVVIETGRRGIGHARPGAIRITEKTPEKLAVEVSAPDPTWLFVLRGYWNSRTVRLDGRPADDEPAQLAFSAVAMPAGRHRLEWIEEAPGIGVFRFGPVLFVVIAAAVLAARPPTRTS